MKANEQRIDVIIFSSKIDRHQKSIAKIVLSLVSKNSISYCKTMNDLSTASLKTLFGLGIILIIARNTQELNEIFNLREKLKDHLMILILGNTKEAMIQKSLTLYPRYTSYMGEDYTDIFIVLEKCFSKYKTNNKGEKMAQSIDTIEGAVRATTIKTGKYLTFTLEREEYGIGILKVKEIIGMMPITSVPRTPDFVKGLSTFAARSFRSLTYDRNLVWAKSRIPTVPVLLSLKLTQKTPPY